MPTLDVPMDLSVKSSTHPSGGLHPMRATNAHYHPHAHHMLGHHVSLPTHVSTHPSDSLLSLELDGYGAGIGHHNHHHHHHQDHHHHLNAHHPLQHLSHHHHHHPFHHPHDHQHSHPHAHHHSINDPHHPHHHHHHDHMINLNHLNHSIGARYAPFDHMCHHHHHPHSHPSHHHRHLNLDHHRHHRHHHHHNHHARSGDGGIDDDYHSSDDHDSASASIQSPSPSGSSTASSSTISSTRAPLLALASNGASHPLRLSAHLHHSASSPHSPAAHLHPHLLADIESHRYHHHHAYSTLGRHPFNGIPVTGGNGGSLVSSTAGIAPDEHSCSISGSSSASSTKSVSSGSISSLSSVSPPSSTTTAVTTIAGSPLSNISSSNNNNNSNTNQQTSIISTALPSILSNGHSATVSTDKKRINRPLTGKHVRHGTGASVATLVTLRNMIKERQRLRALIKGNLGANGTVGAAAAVALSLAKQSVPNQLTLVNGNSSRGTATTTVTTSTTTATTASKTLALIHTPAHHKLTCAQSLQSAAVAAASAARNAGFTNKWLYKQIKCNLKWRHGNKLAQQQQPQLAGIGTTVAPPAAVGES